MKNFKRVISAVIALALSASTLVAVSASKFSDVDSTNNYAEAIEVLTALDIVHGYDEEGGLVFKPEGDITRAEAATMIVGALNMNKDAQAAAGTSKFTDVNEKASWASGYVNVGVAQGFINGMDDTTFAPQDNVTYAQMCVMLTLITGYGDYAAAYGGYPTGYTTMAASAGINKGVALAADAKLQRGQVAQMLYNALTTPLLGVKAYNLNGNDYSVQDGTDLPFKTLLADKFEGYEADVTINAVPKSDDSLKAGEVQLGLNTPTYLDKSKIKAGTLSSSFTGFGTVIDEAGVDDKLFVRGTAIVYQDSNDRWHLVYFKASELDKVVLNAADYVSYAKGGKHADDPTTTIPGTTKNADGKVTFGTKSYRVNSNDTTTLTTGTRNPGEIYVNGKLYGNLNQTNVDTILGLAQGEVTLIDNDKTDNANSNYADGYDRIMTTVYDIAKVGAVVTSNGTTTIQVEPKVGAALNDRITALKFADEDVADGSIDVTVKNAAGEKVALSSIKQGDIIGYAMPWQSLTGTVTPEVIDIRVTDEKVSGKVAREDNTEETYTIGDATYKTVVWRQGLLDVGTSYTMYLDPFGRIYDYADVEAVAYKYAIAEKYDDDYGLQLILPDGTAKYYEVSANNIAKPASVNMVAGKSHTVSSATGTYYEIDTTMAGLKEYLANGPGTSPTSVTDDSLVTFTSYTRGGSKPTPEYRVVKYNVKNSTGKIDTVELLAPQLIPAGSEYKASTEKLDSYTIASTTDVIDATTATVGNYKKFAISSFKDKEQYQGAAFIDSNFGNTAMFVVLTSVGQDINADSRFAVVRKTASKTATAAGDQCYSVSVLYEGEEKDILFNLGSGALALTPGDAIFFKTDSDGLVDNYVPVYTRSAGAALSFGSYGYTAADWNLAADGNFRNITDTTLSLTKKDYQLVYGIVTNVTSRGVELYNPDIFGTTSLYGDSPATYTVADGDWDLDGDGVNDRYNYDAVSGLHRGDTGFVQASATGYDLDAPGTAGYGGTTANDLAGLPYIDRNNTSNYQVFGLKSDVQAYRYAINEQTGLTNQWKAINIGAPTASPISGYEFGRNSSIYLTNALSDGLGANRLTYALALVVNGDIVEIYTITQ